LFSKYNQTPFYSEHKYWSGERSVSVAFTVLSNFYFMDD